MSQVVEVDGQAVEAPTINERQDLLGPLRRFRGLTWVGWANLLVLRWLFVRLAYRVNADNTFGGYFLHRWVWPFPWSNWKRIGERC